MPALIVAISPDSYRDGIVHGCTSDVCRPHALGSAVGTPWNIVADQGKEIRPNPTRRSARVALSLRCPKVHSGLTRRKRPQVTSTMVVCRGCISEACARVQVDQVIALYTFTCTTYNDSRVCVTWVARVVWDSIICGLVAVSPASIEDPHLLWL